VVLITHFHLAPNLNMGRASPPSVPPVACYGVTFTFTFTRIFLCMLISNMEWCIVSSMKLIALLCIKENFPNSVSVQYCWHSCVTQICKSTYIVFLCIVLAFDLVANKNSFVTRDLPVRYS
jgi:hypothetical protein